MPKRVIDFDAMWGSDKLASCAEWAQAEYAWLYGLADASGCFELTNLRVIWGRVAAIRRNLTLERLEQIFNEFQDKGLLFAWEAKCCGRRCIQTPIRMRGVESLSSSETPRYTSGTPDAGLQQLPCECWQHSVSVFSQIHTHSLTELDVSC
jgi:hypothetical protein